MPEYCYICNKCGTRFSVIKSMSKASEAEKCESCKSKKTERDFQAELGEIFIPKTLGHLLDINNDRFSEDKKRHLKEKYEHRGD